MVAPFAYLDCSRDGEGLATLPDPLQDLVVLEDADLLDQVVLELGPGGEGGHRPRLALAVGELDREVGESHHVCLLGASPSASPR